MVDLNDLIQVYDNALEPEVCDFLIQFFEGQQQLQEKIENDYKPNFTQTNLTENCNISRDVNLIHNEIIKKAFAYRDKYYEFVDKRVFPESHAFEQFRIKKYNPKGGDMFDTHVDVKDYASSRRYLSYLWYLNDVDEGGNTVFTGLSIQPKKGKLVMFPPLWMFPHKGEPPMSGPKYILTGYLHYK
jgi:hypothetical protein